MTVIYASFGRPPLHAPTDPDTVSYIIYARDDSDEDLTWREIGELVGMSHMGAYQLYKRWRAWYHSQP
jgi:hypothetical protein